MDELANPYSPGAGTPPPALIGRDDLINQFGVMLRRALVGRSGKSLMPIGLRGVGKTVLLNRFNEIAEQEGIETAYIEAPETGDFRLLLANRLRQILFKMRQSGATTSILKSLRILKAFSIKYNDFAATID